MRFVLLGHRLTIWSQLNWSLSVLLRPIKHEERASALNHLISATDINQLCLTCTVGHTAADTDETVTPPLRLYWVSMYSSCSSTSCSAQVWTTGLFSISVNKVSIVISILWQLWTAHDVFSYCICCDKENNLLYFVTWTYIFSYKILLVLYYAPWSNANGADLPPWLWGMVFQCVTHVANHSCVTNKSV